MAWRTRLAPNFYAIINIRCISLKSINVPWILCGAIRSWNMLFLPFMVIKLPSADLKKVSTETHGIPKKFRPNRATSKFHGCFFYFMHLTNRNRLNLICYIISIWKWMPIRRRKKSSAKHLRCNFQSDGDWKCFVTMYHYYYVFKNKHTESATSNIRLRTLMARICMPMYIVYRLASLASTNVNSQWNVKWQSFDQNRLIDVSLVL